METVSREVNVRVMVKGRTKRKERRQHSGELLYVFHELCYQSFSGIWQRWWRKTHLRHITDDRLLLKRDCVCVSRMRFVFVLSW